MDAQRRAFHPNSGEWRVGGGRRLGQGAGLPIVAAPAADDWTQRAFEHQAMIPLASSTILYDEQTA